MAMRMVSEEILDVYGWVCDSQVFTRVIVSTPY